MQTTSTLSSYNFLIEKLQRFISSYYLQKIVKGILFSALILIPVFLLMSTLEYNIYFGQTVRTIFFWLFILLALYLTFTWIIQPIISYIGVSRRMDNKQAAVIIGQYFPEVSDKLLNVLYLNDQESNSDVQDLINAAINQKTDSLISVKFNQAIDWASNKKLLSYLVLPLIILVGLWLFSPSVIRDSTYRIVNYNKAFAPKAPFDFELVNTSLQVPQYESLQIIADVKGDKAPNKLNLYIDGVIRPMRFDSARQKYIATVENIGEDKTFSFESMGFYSIEYDIKVLPRPSTKSMEVVVIPPTYTNQKEFRQENNGDVTAPNGSKIIWKLKVENTNEVIFTFDSINYKASKFIDGFGISRKALKDENYSIGLKNGNSPFVDSQFYNIKVIPDAYPMINSREFIDSLEDILYYAGDISDDYGLGKLYIVVSYNGKSKKFSIPYEGKKNAFYKFSTRTLFAQYPVGAHLNYYFEIWDNDAIAGGKYSRTQTYRHDKKTSEQIEKAIDNNSSQIKEEIKSVVNDAKDFQKQIQDIKESMVEKKSYDYSDKQKVEELLKEQQELDQRMKDIQENIKRNFDKKNEFTEQEKEILDKQKQLEEISEQMNSPELEELMRKIQELMEKKDKKEMLNNINRLEDNSEKVEKNMERLLMLYKNLDYKQKLNDMIEDLEKLAEKQKDLAKSNAPKDQKQKEQKQLNEELKNTKEDLKNLEKQNNEINDKQKEFDKAQQQLDDASKKQKEASDKMESGDSEGAGSSQEDAGEDIESAANQMKKMKQDQEKEQNAEDARTMRRVLENVMYLSFEQEKLINETQKTSREAPNYVKNVQRQYQMEKDFEIVQDSLYKVASRQPKVKKVIFEEIDKINNNTKSAIENLEDRNISRAVSNQQYAMASYNKLGLMISESLKNMQESNKMEGDPSKSCNNPKSGKNGTPKKGMSMKKLAEMQSQLNQQMESLKKKLEGKEGKQEGGEKSGKSSDESGQNMAEEFAKIAAQQRAIRNAINEIEKTENQPDKSGKSPAGNELKKMMEEMQKTERELYNKKIYQDMIKRQKDIEVKMLESAKALNTQEEELKRESEKAKNTPPELPPDLKRYIDEKSKNKSQINKAPIDLTPYFKSLSEKYFKLIE